MYKLIILSIVILYGAFHSNAQVKIYKVPFESSNANVMEVDVVINGLSRRFIFDTGASSISFGNDFLDLMKSNGFINDDDIIGKTKTKLANGNLVNALIVNIKTIAFGDIKLQDVEALVIDKSNVPFLLGQNVLNQFGSITINNNQKEIIIKGSTNHPKLTDNSLSIDELKLIACNSTALSNINNFEKYFITLPNINKISKDPSVPPINARKRLVNSLVIRFFDKRDKEKAATLKEVLIEKGYQGSDIDIEDMTPYYKTTLSGYLEIWTNK
jgi:hypothetical protein